MHVYIKFYCFVWILKGKSRAISGQCKVAGACNLLLTSKERRAQCFKLLVLHVSEINFHAVCFRKIWIKLLDYTIDVCGPSHLKTQRVWSAQQTQLCAAITTRNNADSMSPETCYPSLVCVKIYWANYKCIKESIIIRVQPKPRIFLFFQRLPNILYAARSCADSRHHISS